MAAQTILSDPMPILTGLMGALISIGMLLWGNKDNHPKPVPVPLKPRKRD